MSLKETLSIAAALADENRVRALLALRDGELCACQLVELLRLANSTVSKHLSVLRQAGLVDSRKEGRWMYYRLPDAKAITPAARRATAWLFGSLRDDPRTLADDELRARICRIEKEELCRMQANDQSCCSCAPVTPAAARWPKDGRSTSRATRSSRTRPGSPRTA